MGQTGLLMRVQVLENMVARDGIEPPTPAFSGLRSATTPTDGKSEGITGRRTLTQCKSARLWHTVFGTGTLKARVVRNTQAVPASRHAPRFTQR